MMNCKDCEKVFAEALYGELGELQQQQFQEHLDDCSQCREQFQGMQMALQIMDKRERSEPDDAFWDNYWDKLEQKLSSGTGTGADLLSTTPGASVWLLLPLC